MAQVETTIELEGGTSVRPFSSLTIVQKFFQHHFFELRCPATVLEDPNEPLLNDTLSAVGKSISIRFRNLNVQNAQEHVFKGIVTNVAIAKSNGAMGDIILSGYSPTILLDDTENCTSFMDLSLSQIVNKLLDPYPKNDLKTEINPAYTSSAGYRVQYNESAFRFIKRLCAMFGEWFFYDGEKLKIGKPSSSDTTELYFGRDLSSFHLAMKVLPNSFKHLHYRMQEHQVIEGASTANVSGLDTFGRQMGDISDRIFSQKNQRLHIGWSKAAADRLALLRKSRNAAKYVSFIGSSDNTGVKLGNIIDVTGVRGSMNNNLDRYGSYLCYSLTHHIDGSGTYSNSFEAVQKELDILEPSPEFPYCESQLATVKDVDDPDKLGRVRVQFMWQKGDEMTPFIRVNMGHAGQDRGMFFVPEKEEQVIVNFREDNPDYPFVAGSLYHGKAKPYDKAVSPKDNNFKCIRTRSGNEIIFCDESGKEYLVIANKDQKNFMKLDLANNQITIHSDGHIQIEGESITMKAKKDILLEAGEKLTAKSMKEMSMTTNDAMKQESLKAFKISTMDELTTSSMKDTKVSATMNLSLSGTMKAEMKGLQASVEGTAQATVKAAMVMIN